MFVSSDGSTWTTMSARELAHISVWKGNRIVDTSHVALLRDAIHGNIPMLNTSPFRIVELQDEEGQYCKYIIDGQHRAMLLKQYFTNPFVDDFQVMVTLKRCESESESISYFKVINTVKPIAWKEDPVLCANKYLAVLMYTFNTDRILIKPGKTCRPFLSADRIRDELIRKRVVEWSCTPDEFLERVHAVNKGKIEALASISPDMLGSMHRRALEYKFALGLDDTFSWI